MLQELPETLRTLGRSAALKLMRKCDAPGRVPTGAGLRISDSDSLNVRIASKRNGGTGPVSILRTGNAGVLGRKTEVLRSLATNELVIKRGRKQVMWAGVRKYTKSFVVSVGPQRSSRTGLTSQLAGGDLRIRQLWPVRPKPSVPPHLSSR